MYNVRRAADELLGEISQVLMAWLHIGACEKCRQRYHEILDHIEELERERSKLEEAQK